MLKWSFHKFSFFKFCTRFNPEHVNRNNKKIKLMDKLPENIQIYLKLGRFDRPVGYVLLFLPCTWGLTLAAPTVPIYFKYMGLTLLGSMLMRSSGCVINDMWDKDIDKKVIRSADRPLASGKLSMRNAALFLSAELGVSLYILLQFPIKSILLGLGIMPIVCIYPYMKRITYMPQLFLGLCFNSGVLICYSIFNHIDATALSFYLGGLIWTIIYDTIYAHMDKVDDKNVGVKSTALLFNDKSKLIFIILTGIMTGLFIYGLDSDYGKVTALAAGALELYFIYKVNLNCPLSCLKYFKANSYVGFVVFLACLFNKYK
jgi:4-hydroxybenzoate polyprenyltransferase